MKDWWRDVTPKELALLVELQRYPSLRSWALRQNMTPMKAGRLLTDLEEKVGRSLFQRSNKGISLTQAGERLAQAAVLVLQSLDKFGETFEEGPVLPFERHVVIGSRGFLNAELAGLVTAALTKDNGNVGVKFLDLSPDEVMQTARGGFIDAALVLEDADLGRSWVKCNVGLLAWNLYGRANHPLMHGGSLADAERFRIGHHCYWNSKQVVTNEGMLHQTYQVRQLGHGSQSAVAALSIAAASSQLACVPSLVAEPFVASGALVRIELSGMQAMEIPVYLFLSVDRLAAAQRKVLTAAVKTRFGTARP